MIAILVTFLVAEIPYLTLTTKLLKGLPSLLQEVRFIFWLVLPVHIWLGPRQEEHGRRACREKNCSRLLVFSQVVGILVKWLKSKETYFLVGLLFYLITVLVNLNSIP